MIGWSVAKIFIACVIISFSTWLAGQRPGLAGFILALPISSMIALFLNRLEFQDSNKSVTFAKSIFFAVPLSLTFFIPFPS
jgi:uncharacterized membrane protein YczE